ncbi:hypothetical protein FACS189490_03900 [Clostridia bacterium]|nr:hypothetical protein FACS189490_03900 [Clostridia bacterium]
MTATSEEIFTLAESYLINLYFSGSRLSTAVAICAAMPDIKAPDEQGRRVLKSCDGSTHDFSVGFAQRNCRTDPDIYAAADGAVMKLSAICEEPDEQGRRVLNPAGFCAGFSAGSAKRNFRNAEFKSHLLEVVEYAR